MVVAVTGASGHIGACLTRLLLAQGHQVRALVRDGRQALRELPRDRFEEVPGCLLDPASLRRTFAGAEVVFHLAAHISIWREEREETYRTNVEGTRQVLAACREVGVRRLVHFSSIHALCRAPEGAPVDESRPLVEDGPSPYDCSKAAAEREVLDAVAQGLDAVVVSPTGVIGPYDFRPSLMGRFFLDLQQRRLLALVRGGFNWVDVRDVALGAIAAATRGRRGERYLLAGEWHSMADLARMAEAATGVRAPRLCVPVWLARAGVPVAALSGRLRGAKPLYTADSLDAMDAYREVRSDKAARELGFRARPIRETVADLYAWRRGAAVAP